jgi:flavorubredoxin
MENREIMAYIADLFKGFADPTRVHILYLLAEREQCVTDIAEAVEDAFRYDRLVLAAATYNADVFPPMRQFITWLTDRGYRNRTVGLIENGSWAPMAGKVMRGLLEGCKDVTILEPVVSIRSALNAESEAQLAALKDALVK